MDGKICQNIKSPTPTHSPSSVQLSTWGRLEDSATNSFYTCCCMLIVLKSFLRAKQNLTALKNFFHIHCFQKYLNSQHQV